MNGIKNRRILVAVCSSAAVVIVGAAIMATHASGFFAASEAENSTLTGNAKLVSDSSASGGAAVLFAAPAASPSTKHFAANLENGQSELLSLGFNVFDISGSTSNPQGPKATIDALPAGTQALVWVGNLDNAPIGSTCPAPGFSMAQFQAQVDALSNDSKVFGYFLSDEPHPSVCPSTVSDIAARADYIHAHASGQKAFIVVLDGTNACGGTYGCEYNALQPSKSHVDLVGIDPYPCHYDTQGVAVPCDTSAITSRVQAAIANGVSASVIVPTFQEFGQEGRTDGKTVYYRTPSAAELTSMLDTWHTLVPTPVMDYAYTWGVQCGASCPAPQALSNHPELQAVAKTHNQ